MEKCTNDSMLLINEGETAKNLNNALNNSPTAELFFL